MRKLTKRAAVLGVAVLLSTAALAAAAVIVSAGLRITVLSQVIPYKLPRDRPAPIAVFIAGHLSTEGGGIPPQLQRLTVKVNRHGLLQSAGLPLCRLSQLAATSSQTALADCAPALIGSGRFWANIVLPGQPPYPTQGRLLIFNGREAGHPVLLAHIYTTNPFNNSFVIAFRLRKISQGPYGTELSASLPQALGEWGYLDRIKLTLRRRYRYRGRALSYFNAACPAPADGRRASFPLAYASFYFKRRQPLGVSVEKTCAVSE